MTEKVLLVDDDAMVLAGLKRQLRNQFSIDTALSGEDALKQVLENGPYAVIVSDFMMPGMNGIETLAEIKKKFPLVEVIMLSGHSTVESAIEGMKKGAFDYLMKPCDMDQITTKVREAVARKRRHEEKIIQARLKEITSRHI